MINSFVGDFIGFQAEFEGHSHGAIHRIVGGCVDISTEVSLAHTTHAGICWGNALQALSIVCLAPSGLLTVCL